ncbi:MAG: hypothetical protein DRP85_08555 [Candidatus Makaraimicrobium thalassicum]|nr:MAG: hypothetical protein DRP85_08555 [Candidatus Omnitrophota bacterium]
MNILFVNLLLAIAMMVIAVTVAAKRPLWANEMAGVFILLTLRIAFYVAAIISSNSGQGTVIMHTVSSLTSIVESSVLIAYGVMLIRSIRIADKGVS